jgi:aquaporin Z
VTAQLSGGLLASALLFILFPGQENYGSTIPSGSESQSFILEVILTFMLMLVIFMVSTGAKEIGNIAGLAIGFMVLLEALFAGPISGASMNPARSFGPAVFSGTAEYLRIYFVAPVIGALISVPCGKYFRAF